MANTVPSYFPQRINLRVPNMAYAADASLQDPFRVDFGAPLALDADGLVDGLVMVNGSAVSVSTLVAGADEAAAIGRYGKVPVESLTTWPDKWGRNITVVASAANARVLTITGYDYLGQKMVETITINGTTTVQGVKAFARVVSFSCSSDTDTTTVDIGWGNKFGLPYAMMMMAYEMKNGVVAANAGTIVGAVTTDPQTATTTDPRGTYLPVTVIPDGTNTFEIGVVLRRSNLHGVAHYAG